MAGAGAGDGAGDGAMHLGLVERRGISHAFGPFRNKRRWRLGRETGLGLSLGL